MRKMYLHLNTLVLDWSFRLSFVRAKSFYFPGLLHISKHSLPFSSVSFLVIIYNQSSSLYICRESSIFLLFVSFVSFLLYFKYFSSSPKPRDFTFLYITPHAEFSAVCIHSFIFFHCFYYVPCVTFYFLCVFCRRIYGLPMW